MACIAVQMDSGVTAQGLIGLSGAFLPRDPWKTYNSYKETVPQNNHKDQADATPLPKFRLCIVRAFGRC